MLTPYELFTKIIHFFNTVLHPLLLPFFPFSSLFLSFLSLSFRVGTGLLAHTGLDGLAGTGAFVFAGGGVEVVGNPENHGRLKEVAGLAGG